MMFRLAFRFLWLTLLLSSWVLATAQTGKRQALLIGLSSYAPSVPGRTGVSHLPTGHRDAQRTSDRLKALGWDVTLLTSVPGATDSPAKKADILNALRSMGKNPNDQVLVVYSGHGFRVRNQDYLTAFDTYLDSSEEVPKLVVDSLISVEKELGEVFSTMKARRRLLVVDACRDTPNTETKGDGQSPDAGNLASKLGEAVGLSREGSVFAGVLFSCAPLERSYVDGDLDDGKGASVFTEGLLVALSDPNSTIAGVLRPEAVAIQAATFVQKWAAKQNKKMNPRWVPSPNNDLTLGFDLGRLDTPIQTDLTVADPPGFKVLTRGKVTPEGSEDVAHIRSIEWPTANPIKVNGREGQSMVTINLDGSKRYRIDAQRWNGSEWVNVPWPTGTAIRIYGASGDNWTPIEDLTANGVVFAPFKMVAENGNIIARPTDRIALLNLSNEQFLPRYAYIVPKSNQAGSARIGFIHQNDTAYKPYHLFITITRVD